MSQEAKSPNLADNPLRTKIAEALDGLDYYLYQSHPKIASVAAQGRGEQGAWRIEHELTKAGIYAKRRYRHKAGWTVTARDWA